MFNGAFDEFFPFVPQHHHRHQQYRDDEAGSSSWMALSSSRRPVALHYNISYL